jgi:hypothetical protein
MCPVRWMPQHSLLPGGLINVGLEHTGMGEEHPNIDDLQLSGFYPPAISCVEPVCVEYEDCIIFSTEEALAEWMNRPES